MAMTACRECSHEVSAAAKACPQCGVPRPAMTNPGGAFARDAALAVLVFAALVLLALLAFGVL